MIANIPKAEIGIIDEKQVPKNATKFVIEVAIIALEAFLKVYAVLFYKSFLRAGIYPVKFHVSLKRNVLSAPIPRIIRTTKI